MTRSPDVLPQDEQELQERLGTNVDVTYEFVPIQKVRKHRATLCKLLGGEEGDTVLVCRCGWAMRLDEKVKLDEGEKLFVGHVQPGLEYIA